MFSQSFNFIKKLGPGLLFAGAAIGVSHLVQSTRAGADFGFGLIWALVLIHIIKYPFFQFGPRYATATGESLLDGYKKLGKGILAIYFVLNIAIMFTIQAAVTIVTAGLASTLFGISTNPVIWGVAITIICFILLIIGKYKLLDSLIKVIIVLLTISTIISVIIAANSAHSLTNFTQILPNGTIEISFLIAFLGWMPAPLDVSIWQSLWCIEKHKNNKTSFNTKQAIFDFNIGYATTLLLGVCFIGLGAFVMFGSGETFSASAGKFSQQLILLYTKNLGEGLFIFIGAAAFTTMFSTTITTLDASPRAMTKAFNLLTNKPNKNMYWFWISFLAIGTCLILLFFMSNMASLIKIATILSFITTPFYGICNYLLIIGKHTPKEHQPNTALKILSGVGITFLIGFNIWFLLSL